MKNTTLLVFCLLGIPCVFGQHETHKAVKQQSNGVVILESTGVQSASEPFKSNPVRTIDDWTLPECEDALRYIDEKLKAVPLQDDNYERIVSYYKEEQAKIEKRKQTLTAR